MFDHEPSAEEISEWFARFKLDGDMDHGRYVGGIVAIENKQGGNTTWSLYVNATARITYFWDWIELNKYRAEFNVSKSDVTDIELPEGKKARYLVMQIQVNVWNQEGDLIRKTSGVKQVALTSWNNYLKKVVADANVFMKAETGALARALGTMGMLTFPGSGVATAEDMKEFQFSAGEEPDNDIPTPKVSKAAPNPKS